MEIKEVIFTSEANFIVLVLVNDKQITRKLKRSLNDDSLYFVYKKREYYINRLNMLNIELVEY